VSPSLLLWSCIRANKLTMPEAVLAALIKEGEVALTLSDHRLTAKLHGHGQLIRQEQWLTIEMNPKGGRFHVCRNHLDHYEVMSAYGCQRAVHFFDVDGHQVFTCTMLGTAEGEADFAPERLVRFTRLIQQDRSLHRL
jgi:hypothetical protein